VPDGVALVVSLSKRLGRSSGKRDDARAVAGGAVEDALLGGSGQPADVVPAQSAPGGAD